jgi:hypothetical protein
MRSVFKTRIFKQLLACFRPTFEFTDLISLSQTVHIIKLGLGKGLSPPPHREANIS